MRGAERLKFDRSEERIIVARLLHGGFNLGGEQSGHIIMSDYATTGDGLIASPGAGSGHPLGPTDEPSGAGFRTLSASFA